MAMPANVGFGTVVGRFLRATLDGSDEGREPDGIPIPGLIIRFTPSVARFRNATASPPTMFIVDPIAVTTDSDGVLVGPDGIPGVRLVATNDPQLDPTNFTYAVSISGSGVPAIAFNVQIPEGGTVDLALATPVSSSTGSQVGPVSSVAGLSGAVAVEALAELLSPYVGSGGGGGAGVSSVNSRTGSVSLTKGDVGLGNADNTSDADKPISNATQTALNTKAASAHSHAISDVTSLTSTLSSKADLVGGVIPTSQLPAIAITEFLGSVASQSAMLALTGQRGDWAIRSDTSETWIISGDTPSSIGSWTKLVTPAGSGGSGAVASVNGQTGVVVLGASDVGARASNWTPAVGDVPSLPASKTTSGTFDSARLPGATETAIGAAERATSAEVLTGTDTTRYVSPAGLQAKLNSLAIMGEGNVAGLDQAGWGRIIYVNAGAPVPPGTPDYTLVVELPVLTEIEPKSTPTLAAVTSGTSITINAPTGISAGDILIANIRSQSTAATDLTPPAGWARIGVPFDGGASGGRIQGSWLKVATGSEPSTYTFTVGGRVTAAISVWPGDRVTSTVVGYANDYRGTWDGSVGGRRVAAYTASAPGISFFLAGSEMSDGFASTPTSAPAGYTQLVNHQTGSGTTGSRTALWVGYRQVSAGSVESAALGYGGGAGGEGAHGLTLGAS